LREELFLSEESKYISPSVPLTRTKVHETYLKLYRATFETDELRATQVYGGSNLIIKIK
jgi:hypothetical protein